MSNGQNGSSSINVSEVDNTRQNSTYPVNLAGEESYQNKDDTESIFAVLYLPFICVVSEGFIYVLIDIKQGVQLVSQTLKLGT